MATKTFNFLSQKYSSDNDEYLDWSHDRVSINSEFYFLPENEIVKHFS